MTNKESPQSSTWNSSHNHIKSPALKKSTRDWNAKSQITQLPLVSRVTFSNEAAKEESLINIDIQHDMWVALIEKAAKIKNKDDPTQWEPIVDLLRALREGIYASQWSEGDLEFSVKVFEQSTICCIQANNSDELLKSMRVLVDELYQIPNVVPKNYYRALYCLFLAFHDRTSGLDRINEISAHLPESKFVKAVVYCVIVAEDPIQFFALYNDCPDRYFKLLMDTYMDKIRLLSINILSKAYMRVPISFAAHCLGLSDIKKTVPTIERLVKPTCIDRVDLDTSTIYFIRKKADKK